MNLAQKILIAFMVSIILSTLYEYYYNGDEFEEKFGGELKSIPIKSRKLKNTLLFLYGLAYQAMKMVSDLMIFILLLITYWYGPIILGYLELRVQDNMRARGRRRG